MPELPEVETARRMLERVAVGRRIARVRCADDPIVFEGVSPARFAAALRGRQVLGARRKGKHLWLVLDRRPWPLFHFGMSGGFHTPARRSLPLMSGGGAPEGWPPRFTRLTVWFDDGGVVAFADARRLGRIRLRHDPPAEPPVSLLGFDATANCRRRVSFESGSGSAGRRSRPCSSTRRSPPGSATGSPTRCSTRPGSRPTGASTR